jgi:hypothetical protein
MVFFIPGPDSRPLRISYSIDPSFQLAPILKQTHADTNRTQKPMTFHKDYNILVFEG